MFLFSRIVYPTTMKYYEDINQFVTTNNLTNIYNALIQSANENGIDTNDQSKFKLDVADGYLAKFTIKCDTQEQSFLIEERYNELVGIDVVLDITPEGYPLVMETSEHWEM